MALLLFRFLLVGEPSELSADRDSLSLLLGDLSRLGVIALSRLLGDLSLLLSGDLLGGDRCRSYLGGVLCLLSPPADLGPGLSKTPLKRIWGAADWGLSVALPLGGGLAVCGLNPRFDRCIVL